MAWPKGKPRGKASGKTPAAAHKMRAKPNWETATFDDEDKGRLHIGEHDFPEDMDLQWVTHSVYGQEDPQHRASFEKHGWTPVHPEDFDGRFDGKFTKKGSTDEVQVDGLVLMARPMELSKAARAKEKREAERRIRIKEQAWKGGDIGVSDAFSTDHPSARAATKINRTYERVVIPESGDEE